MKPCAYVRAATVDEATAAFAGHPGAEPTRAAVEQAVDAELSMAEPLRDNAFKVPLARNLACGVLTRLTGRD